MSDTPRCDGSGKVEVPDGAFGETVVLPCPGCPACAKSKSEVMRYAAKAGADAIDWREQWDELHPRPCRECGGSGQVCTGCDDVPCECYTDCPHCNGTKVEPEDG